MGMAINITRKKTLASTLLIADTFFSSLLGLMGRRCLPDGEGLWINPCQAVHSMWMRFPIDVVFLGDARSVVHLVEGLRPFRITRFVSVARSVIEIPAGTVARTETKVGDRIEIIEE